MTQAIATQQQNRDALPMTSVGMASGVDGNRIAPQNLGEVVKFAEVMARAGKMIPAHLQGDVGACMAITLQALEWRYNPFAVAQKTYFVQNRIAYEAQLIAAVVNTRSGIKGRLRYDYEGEGAELTCTVTGVLDGQECVYTSPPVGAITTKNSPLWKSDVRQQLGYFSARSWARRHCPEVILGVYDRDEVESIKDVTPAQGTGLASRLQGAQGGFNAQTIESTLEEAQGRQGGDSGTQEPEEDKTPSATAAADPSAVADEKPDPEVERDAAVAALDGASREPPEGLSELQTQVWFQTFDKVTAEAEAI